ncbi:nuclear transport factor 2 family protein [Pedobacter endophyticus]|uniref:Nuclear transport factor 2 family protein n=1 Tax=Pedobacter endophyticus TaxID=2789740 RepID=A0A7U3Q6K9_9SPHI|nr:nuclear transport factor 2 family protein [Pedobacter endophyticus]QPH38902.1 nuclear transport factor 2 family protein [Pedobacter endophyticus]
MTNTTLTQKVVNLFLQSLSQRDLKNLIQMFAEDIDWNIPGDKDLAPWLGKRSSRDEVEEFYELLWKNTVPKSAKVNNIMVNNSTAIVSGEFSTIMLKTNKVVDSMFFIEISVENSLIVKYRLLEDSYAVSLSLKEDQR